MRSSRRHRLFDEETLLARRERDVDAQVAELLAEKRRIEMEREDLFRLEQAREADENASQSSGDNPDAYCRSWLASQAEPSTNPTGSIIKIP